MLAFELLQFACFVHLFKTILTDSHSLIVAKFRNLHEVLRTLAAYSRAALTTMMLPLPEAELHNTYEALVHFLHGP